MVFKFNIAGSLQQLKNLEEATAKTLPPDRTFIEGVSTKYLYIPQLKDVMTQQNDMARTSAYAAASIMTESGPKSLFNYILEACAMEADN